nr:hypothetical protein [Tanacetum cinerariifolium]
MANETLPDFKERWTEEMGYIKGVPEVMMKRVDDFVKSEEAYNNTELPKGEHLEKGKRTPYKGNMPPLTGHEGKHQRVDNYNANNHRDHYQTYILPRVYNRSQGSVNIDLDRAGGVFRGTTNTNGKNQTECNVRKYEGASSYLLHNLCNDEVSRPKGVATLVARTTAIFECRRLEEKQTLSEGRPGEKALRSEKEPEEEKVLVNPMF